MKTKTIGELLKSQRQHHNLTIAELAAHTKIRPDFLEALEENSFEKLPSAVFVKGYIKTYCSLFGVDDQPLLAILRRDFKESAAGQLVPRDFIKPMLKKRQMWTPVTMAVLVLGVIFLTLISYVGLQWYNIQKPPKLVLTEPTENQFVSATIPVSGHTVSDAIVTVNEQPIGIKSDGSFQTEVYLPKEGIHTITIEATDRRGKTSVVQRAVHVQP
jgi:cytoskeletal protein RodZ